MTELEFKQAIRACIAFDSDATPLIQRRGTRSPHGWLFDMKRLILDAEWLDTYANLFWERYGDHYPFQIGGIESTGIALVAAIALKGRERGTPVNAFYIRKSRKKDGKMNMIEGELDGTPVILVDDILNTGTSLMKQVLALANIGVHVGTYHSIVRFRDMKKYMFITKHGLALESLYTLDQFDLCIEREQHAPVHNAHRVVWRFLGREPHFEHVAEKSAPALDTTYAYMGTDDGSLVAIDKNSGRLAWSFDTQTAHRKGIISSPAVHDGTVFFGGYDGNVYAAACADGARKWVYRGADWVGSSPSLAPDIGLLLIGLEFARSHGKGGIAALSLESGEAKWTDSFDEFVHCSPLYVEYETAAYIADNAGTVRAYDARTGKKTWEKQVGGAVKSSFAYEPQRRLLLFGAHDGIMHGLSAVDGKEMLSFATAEPIYSTPATRDGVAYVASLDKTLYAVDIDSGSLRWKLVTGGRIFASPHIIDDAVWIGSNDGCLYEIDATSGTVRTIQHFAERIVNKVAHDESTGRIFVPTIANELYCLDKDAASQ